MSKRTTYYQYNKSHVHDKALIFKLEPYNQMMSCRSQYDGGKWHYQGLQPLSSITYLLEINSIQELTEADVMLELL